MKLRGFISAITLELVAAMVLMGLATALASRLTPELIAMLDAASTTRRQIEQVEAVVDRIRDDAWSSYGLVADASTRLVIRQPGEIRITWRIADDSQSVLRRRWESDVLIDQRRFDVPAELWVVPGRRSVTMYVGPGGSTHRPPRAVLLYSGLQTAREVQR